MGLSLPHLIVLALVVLLLFGRGKISEMMGDFGKGIKSFKEGIADETTNRPITPPAQLTVQQPMAAVPPPQAYAPPPAGAPAPIAPAAAASPHPEVVPHGQPQVAQPMLNGEPLTGYAADTQAPR